MKRIFFVVAVITAACASLTAFFWNHKSYLEIGMPAPDFTLIDDQGTHRALSEFRGKKVVLYFYPKDNTPHCTAQACSFRNQATEYAENNIIVLGINYDSPESHKIFKAQHNLPFILLSDSEKKVAQLYETYGMFFPKRMTFLIDENGILIERITHVDVTEDAKKIIRRFELKKESKA